MTRGDRTLVDAVEHGPKDGFTAKLGDGPLHGFKRRGAGSDHEHAGPGQTPKDKSVRQQSYGWRVQQHPIETLRNILE